jgi:hypothetical protein
LEAVQEPRLQPAAGRREIVLIQLNGGSRRRFGVLRSRLMSATVAFVSGRAGVTAADANAWAEDLAKLGAG